MTYLWKYGDSLWNILRLNKSLTMWSRTTAILMNDFMIFFFFLDPGIILRAICFVFLDSCRTSCSAPNTLGKAGCASSLGGSSRSQVVCREGTWEPARHQNSPLGTCLASREMVPVWLSHIPSTVICQCASISQ